MKGILLSGGSGSRLNPITLGNSKQLLPIYDKPMFYHPLSTLLLAGIDDIYIITNPQFVDLYKSYFGDGSKLNIKLTYIVQNEPKGIADAFLLTSPYIEGKDVALILGDNIFYGPTMSSRLKSATENVSDGFCTIFGYEVSDPRDFGNALVDSNGFVSKIIEKPSNPISNIAVTGLYFYNSLIWQEISCLKPSARGELEITDLNQILVDKKKIFLEKLGRGFAWFDAGSIDKYLECCNFIKGIQSNQGYSVASPEEVCYRNGWINDDTYLKSIEVYKYNDAIYQSLKNAVNEINENSTNRC